MLYEQTRETRALFRPSLPYLCGVLIAVIFLSCSSAETAAPEEPFIDNFPHTGMNPGKNPFIHASGRDLVDAKGKKILLKGIAFGNEVWNNPYSPPANHHGEIDYERCRDLGINSVRFYMNYRIFENDDTPYHYKQGGFDWLDKNISWAKKTGITLILNMHVPQGGFQSNAGGGALWKNRGNQKRLTALWKEIANRYRDEPVILGYDLLNEPVVTHDIVQWERLAKETVAAIREVDQKHLIIVERLNAVIISGSNADWSENRNGNMNFFMINDTNIMYEFHFYKPMALSHQGASWIPALLFTRTTYPGPFKDWDGSSKHADRQYIENELMPYVDFGLKNNVPLYLGEFGIIRAGWEGNRNGGGWVKDVIDIMFSFKINVNYHDYHESSFGLYYDEAQTPPMTLNKALADVLRKKYGGK